MKYLLFIVPLAVAILTCDGPFNPFAESVGRELNPINIGDKYIYSVENQNGTIYDSVIRFECTYLADTVINDVKMYPQVQVAYYADSTIKWTITAYDAQDDFGFYHYLSESNLDYPIPYLYYPIYVGRKWNLTVEENFFSDYDTLAARVLAKEDVDTYLDCWKVYLELINLGDTTFPVFKITSYYKQGIGMVKTVQEIGSNMITMTLQEKVSVGK
jgi:hypothetical protein